MNLSTVVAISIQVLLDIDLDGNCDFNIVIRTAVHKDGKYYLGVGGGITYESELEFEYEETLQKAKAVIEALR